MGQRHIHWFKGYTIMLCLQLIKPCILNKNQKKRQQLLFQKKYGNIFGELSGPLQAHCFGKNTAEKCNKILKDTCTGQIQYRNTTWYVGDNVALKKPVITICSGGVLTWVLTGETFIKC